VRRTRKSAWSTVPKSWLAVQPRPVTIYLRDSKPLHYRICDTPLAFAFTRDWTVSLIILSESSSHDIHAPATACRLILHQAHATARCPRRNLPTFCAGPRNTQPAICSDYRQQTHSTHTSSHGFLRRHQPAAQRTCALAPGLRRTLSPATQEGERRGRQCVLDILGDQPGQHDRRRRSAGDAACHVEHGHGAGCVCHLLVGSGLWIWTISSDSLRQVLGPWLGQFLRP
jgi:hypothetical protein